MLTGTHCGYGWIWSLDPDVIGLHHVSWDFLLVSPHEARCIRSASESEHCSLIGRRYDYPAHEALDT